MLRPRDRQRSFYDADSVCERLIPQDSFYRKFREIVWPLIEDEHFKDMYCKDNGRPSISPALLAMATILQFYRNLSDREMERACMYDIEVKYALGLRLDDRPFDHSSLGDFRERLLENGREKEVFDRILDHLVNAGLIKKNEIQRIDATHVIADIAIPTMVMLIKKGVFEVLKQLKGRHKEAYTRIGKGIDLEEYEKEKVHQEGPGRLDMENRERKLVEVVSHAKTVLMHTRNVKVDRELRRRIDVLKRILQENIEEGEEGDPQEIHYKEKPKDIMVSPIDSDARYGMKSERKRFVGYKANITETVESRFITNIKAMRGNVHDGKNAIETVVEQKELGIVPSKVIGDTAYGEANNRKVLHEHGTELVSPLGLRNTRTRAIFPKSMFRYDQKRKTLTCPQGVRTKMSFMDRKKGLTVYHFPMKKCNRCPVQRQCTNDRDGRRTVGMSPLYTELRRAEQYNQTKEFREDMKLRPPIEGKVSELTRYHGLRRCRYRGLTKLGLQCYFTAAAVNIKRWVKVVMDKLKPKIPRLLPV